MPNPLIAMVGSTVAGAAVQSNSTKKATNAQTAAANKSISEQQRQFDETKALLAPYVQAGDAASAEMQALIGLSGAGAQSEALQAIQDSPQLATAIQLGEEAMLANASATGGLRGGNTQAALMEYRPQLFSQMIDQRYGQLSGLANSGQAAAAGQASAGQAMANNVSNAYGEIGAAQAGGALARGQALGGVIGGASSLLGMQQSGALNMPQGAGVFSKWGF